MLMLVFRKIKIYLLLYRYFFALWGCNNVSVTMGDIFPIVCSGAQADPGLYYDFAT